MSQQLVQSVSQLVESGEALPAELQALDEAARAALSEATRLGERADSLTRQLELEVQKVPQAVDSLRNQLTSSRAQLSDTSRELQKSLAALSSEQDGFTTGVVGMTARLSSAAETLRHGMLESIASLDAAAAAQVSTVDQGLAALEGAWNKLEAALTESRGAAEELTQAARDARLGEQQQITMLDGHLQQTHGALIRDFDDLRATAQQSEERFVARIAEVLSQIIIARSEQVERLTGELLERDVSVPSEQRAVRFIEQAVLYMAAQARVADELLLPPRHNIERQVKRYAAGRRLKPMLKAAQVYLAKFGQDLPYAERLNDE